MSTQEKLEEIVTPQAFGFDQYHNSSCPECMFNFAEARQELTHLIESAKREGARQELEYMMTGEKTVTQYADSNFDDVVTYIFAASEIQDRIAQLEQSEESEQ